MLSTILILKLFLKLHVLLSSILSAILIVTHYCHNFIMLIHMVFTDRFDGYISSVYSYAQRGNIESLWINEFNISLFEYDVSYLLFFAERYTCLNMYSNTLHTHSLFKWLGMRMINYTIYHGMQKGMITRLMTSYLTSLNRMTPEKLPVWWI